MPPLPKPAATRQRRNRSSTHAQLPSVESMIDATVPRLPRRAEGWHPMVRGWWRSVWTSPMASEFVGPDVRGGLYLLAELHQRRWEAESAKDLVCVAAEIRLQEVRFGLSPIDRRRLQWEIDKGDQAEQRTTNRRKSAAQEKKDNGGSKDPREMLKVV